MTDDEARDRIDEGELAAQDAQELPAREAMSLIDVGGEGGLLPLPDPIGADDTVGGRHTLPVEPPTSEQRALEPSRGV